MNIPPDKKAPVIFKTGSDKMASIIKREKMQIQALAKVESIALDPHYMPGSTDASAVMTDIEIYVPLRNLIDIDKERARIDKEVSPHRIRHTFATHLIRKGVQLVSVPSVSVRSLPTPVATGASQAGEGAAAPSS